MGASGAGKTSLLNIISKRASMKPGQSMEGKVCINDKEIDKESFSKYSCYIMQDDILFEHFTVRQSLEFSAGLRLAHLSREKQLEKVQETLKDLGLEGCADTKVGSTENKGLSGGERKRLAIAYELIVDPALILLDEPTSGLDSFKSTNLCKVLNKLARRGKTVIATIH
mmetsp:Transcript_40623/g.29238  ORF Transcript_40623/g.29238 Transcript_40623/m.29238 type:complete len:169 (+) Transcript_40623:453-959(+)